MIAISIVWLRKDKHYSEIHQLKNVDEFLVSGTTINKVIIFIIINGSINIFT